MDSRQLCREVRKRHEKGESYKSIGESLGLSAPTVDRVAHGIVSKKVATALSLDPSPALLSTRRRRAALNKIARSLGFPSWSVLETEAIKQAEWKV